MSAHDPSSTRSIRRAPLDKAAAERRLELELEQTFPASDAIPWIHDVETAAPAPGPLYLEDLAAGRRFATGEVAVSADEIKAFAARFDPQEFHLDEGAAAVSAFGGLVASGWHTAAMSMRLLVDGDMRIAGGLVGVGGEIAWSRPVRPGDVLRVVSEVLDVAPSRSRPDRGIVTIRNETLNQRDEPVQVAVMKLAVPRRPRGAQPSSGQ